MANPKDRFGGLEFPAQVPGADEAVTDRAIGTIAAYLAAVIRADLQAAWSRVAPGQSVVEQSFTSDPEDSTFNERDLPALFVWRRSDKTESWTDDWVRVETDVGILWVWRPQDQVKRSLRAPIYNGIRRAVDRALYLGRHPAWVDPDDEDPTAQELGSVLMTRAGLVEWPEVSTSKVAPITIQMLGHESRKYPAILCSLSISEITEWAPGTRGAAAEADWRVQNAFGDVIASVEQLGGFTSGFTSGFRRSFIRRTGVGTGFTSGFSSAGFR